MSYKKINKAMIILKKISSILLVLIGLSGCFSEKKDEVGTLTVGSSIDYPPFEFFQNGNMVGFDMDLINEIAKRLNYKVKIKDMSFDSIIGALQSNRIDLAISSLSPTPSRLNAVDFSMLYNVSNLSVVSLKKNPITEINELKNKTVGVQSGSIYEHYVSKNLNTKNYNIKIKQLPKIPDLIQDLKSNRVSGIIMGSQEAIGVVTSQKNLVMDMIPVFDTEKTVLGQAIAFPKGSKLKEKVNKIINEMNSDGSMEKIKKKWNIL